MNSQAKARKKTNKKTFRIQVKYKVSYKGIQIRFLIVKKSKRFQKSFSYAIKRILGAKE